MNQSVAEQSNPQLAAAVSKVEKKNIPYLLNQFYAVTWRAPLLLPGQKGADFSMVPVNAPRVPAEPAAAGSAVGMGGDYNFEKSTGLLDGMKSPESKVLGPEPAEKGSVPEPVPTIPPEPKTDGTEKTLEKVLEKEEAAVSKAEAALSKQENEHQKGKAEASRSLESGMAAIGSSVMDEMTGKIKSLGNLAKADQLRTAGARLTRAAKGAFRQGMVFGWPWGAAIGAAAAAVTVVAGKAMISRIAAQSFEDGGPVMGPRADAAVEKSSDRAPRGKDRNITPVINVEVDGDADPSTLQELQAALDDETEFFARNLELSRQW